MNITGCLKCGDEKAVLQKSGFKKTKAGSFQRFLCTSCGKHFTGQERHRRHTAAEQQRALMEHEEGLSMRAAARLAGVHLRSVQRWIEKKPQILSTPTTTMSTPKKRAIPIKTH